MSFGLVSFPIRLHTAVREQDVKLHNVHRDCGSRVSMPKVCRTCDREVEAADLIYGYEYAKDLQVLIEKGDLDDLPLSSSTAVEVSAFVPLADVPALLFQKSYYVGPDARGKVGHKAYALFRDVLAETGKAAVAKLAMRSKEQVCLIRPHGKALAITLLHWPDELVASDDVEGLAGDVEVSEAERALALQLVESLSKPAAVINEAKDEYRLALSTLVEAKVAGSETAPIPLKPHPERSPVVDLVTALEQSIAKIKPRRRRAAGAPKKARAKAAAAPAA